MPGKLINLRNVIDLRGGLVFVESQKDINFEIKRVYYLYDLKNKKRGQHAHKDLKQIMICVSGACNVLLDDGIERKEYLLDEPSVGLLIDSPMWREMYNFSDNCVLLVLASNYYDSSDYIHYYEEFKDFVKK